MNRSRCVEESSTARDAAAVACAPTGVDIRMLVLRRLQIATTTFNAPGLRVIVEGCGCLTPGVQLQATQQKRVRSTRHPQMPANCNDSLCTGASQLAARGPTLHRNALGEKHF